MIGAGGFGGVSVFGWFFLICCFGGFWVLNEFSVRAGFLVG
jgi:hypothetical protein